MSDELDNGPDPAAGLLPAGLRDVLPPRAELEAVTTERLMAVFQAWGYARVKPPLAEFEETLLAGAGHALAGQTFRFMDPTSQRMLGLRPDITLPVARIAATRLRGEPRPLRLSYAGQVLRTRGSQLRPERQFAQAGFELIGSAAPEADLEVALLAAEAVQGLGVANLSLDLTHPQLVPVLCEGLGLDAATAKAARLALDHKDGAALHAAVTDKGVATLLATLLDSGESATVLAAVGKLKLPAAASALVDEIAWLIAGIKRELPGVLVTLDLGEFRGFEYHSGIAFSLFARNVRGELGRGGRYLAGLPATNGGDAAAEPATGCTVYLDSLMRALPAQPAARLLYLPPGTPRAVARHWQAQGWAVLQGFDAGTGEAARLKCSHELRDGAAKPL